jgi:hypothetical protein
MTPWDHVATTRRTFLALCAATAGAAMLPPMVRLRALNAYAVTSFAFTDHERAVLKVAADTVVPGANVLTRYGLRAIPSAGDTGTVDFIQNLLSGALIYAAGVQRADYAMPVGLQAPVFPATGAVPMWTVKRLGWYGDGPRPTRPYAWPSELDRLQKLYRAGVVALDAAVAPAAAGFDVAPLAARENALRAMQVAEVTVYNGRGEGNQPFFLTLLDHVAQACFGDPIYGGNGGNDPTGKNRWIYWKMIGFNGPSYTSFGGPGPNQGWTAAQMAGPFIPTKPF